MGLCHMDMCDARLVIGKSGLDLKREEQNGVTGTRPARALQGPTSVAVPIMWS